MKIIVPTFEKIEWMPPTIYLLEQLADMGHHVVYITIYPDHYFDNRCTNGRIRNISLCKKNLTLQSRFPYIKGFSGLLLRLDNLIKRLISAKLKRVIDAEMTKDSLLWIVNEMTVMLAGTRFYKGREFIFTIYELHERKIKMRSVERTARAAKIVVVPEYCRAHIMQSRYHLQKTPLVLPNKTDIHIFNQCLSSSAQEAVQLLEHYRHSGVTTVLYMGGISPERPLIPILEAIKDSKYFRLAIMGRPTDYLQKLQDTYPDCFDYLGAFSPPEHIQVAKHAGIGLLIYVSINQIQGLNALFCAPNKLYEYSGQGLPVIGNDIPGLRFPIIMNNIGCIADFSNSSSILNALETIQANYNDYSLRAKKFYNNVDLSSVVHQIIQQFNA